MDGFASPTAWYTESSSFVWMLYQSIASSSIARRIVGLGNLQRRNPSPCKPNLARNHGAKANPSADQMVYFCGTLELELPVGSEHANDTRCVRVHWQSCLVGRASCACTSHVPGPMHSSAGDVHRPRFVGILSPHRRARRPYLDEALSPGSINLELTLRFASRNPHNCRIHSEFTSGAVLEPFASPTTSIELWSFVLSCPTTQRHGTCKRTFQLPPCEQVRIGKTRRGTRRSKRIDGTAKEE